MSGYNRDDAWNGSSRTFTRGRGSRGNRGYGGQRNSAQGSGPDLSNNDENNKYNHQRAIGQTVSIKRSLVGRIIGKGGSKIREMQEESGAHIVVDKSDNYSDNVDIMITGSEESQTKAVNLINSLVEENGYNNHRGGQNRYNGDASNDGNSGSHYGNSGSNYGSYGSNYGNSNTNYGSNSSNYGNSGSNYGNAVESKTPEAEDNEPINWQELIKQCEIATAEKWSKFPPINKCFYKEDPEVAGFTQQKVEEIRYNNNKTTVSRFEDSENLPIPNPVMTFEQCFSQYPDILDEIYKQKFEKPSPIQAQAWPVLLSGDDLIGIAQTGTGKTLAFLLPALIHIEGQDGPKTGPNVLILAPTRELALQIEKEVAKYQYRDIKSVCVYGGGSRKNQVNVITKGVNIVIATPGRLNDLVVSNVIDVSSVTYLVLDEADRMLDMGFEPQIRKILIDVRPTRQTIMTSATWPSGVRRLAQSYMQKPVQICVGSMDLAAVHSVTQVIQIIDEDDKFNEVFNAFNQTLNEIVKFSRNMEPTDKAIIFCGKKSRADHLSSEFCLMNIKCNSIHGDREQCDREQALQDIKTGEVQILIATDVASRGIDIEDITHVVNFDFPRNIEEYVHRVGRTGRAGKTGKSISFFTRSDWSQAKELIAILEEADQEIPEELLNMSGRFEIAQQKRAADRQREKIDGGRSWGARSGDDGYRGGGGRRGGNGGFNRFGGSRGGSKW